MYLAKSERSGYSVLFTRARPPHRAAAGAHRRRCGAASTASSSCSTTSRSSICAPASCVGVEALLRWNHPEQGRLLPQDFIRVAEHTGLITPLTEFAIDRALVRVGPRRQGAGLLASPSNLSPRSLHDPSLPGARAAHAAQHTREPGRALALEITENMIMSDPERSTRCLGRAARDGRAHDRGRLRHRLLLAQLSAPLAGRRTEDRQVVRHRPGRAAKTMRWCDRSSIWRTTWGCAVVAEGVETGEVRDRLRALGCDAAQGFSHLSPAPAPQSCGSGSSRQYLRGPEGLRRRAIDFRPDPSQRRRSISRQLFLQRRQLLVLGAHEPRVGRHRVHHAVHAAIDFALELRCAGRSSARCASRRCARAAAPSPARALTG